MRQSGALHVGPMAFSDRRAGDAVLPMEHEQQLLAAVSISAVTAAGVAFEQGGDLAKGEVAGLVAELVVVGLEAVEVAEHEAVGLAVALSAGGELDQVLAQA